MILWKKSLENIVRKGENAENLHFPLSQQFFYRSQNKFYLVICKCFQVGLFYNSVVWQRVNPFPDDKF